ncbi:DnaD domain protein [Vallitalea pronyensis]|uniref:DnaD domain protein n=1 Tax=Vallitalea pronyensis TaxID=1348613 RepID=A0A8J8SIG0_9FIRM|nr:DnaD domain protein [Vallitalea pronyensis]QUI24895.1 DnaD domain protein [Vallitalea pronyensis]
MAERRMFAKTIIDSDAFLDMPLSTQALYFHLSMRADDDGFLNNPLKIMRVIGCNKNDFDLLVGKKFIITFDKGVIVIKHWKIHNYIRKDRYKETIHKEEKSLLAEKENGSYTLMSTIGIPLSNQADTQMETQYRLGKDRLGKDRLEVVVDIEEQEQNELKKVVKSYQDNLGMINPIIYEKLIDYLKDVPCEVIIAAIEESVLNNKKNFNYLSAILNNWISKDVKCLQDVRNIKDEFKNKKASVKPNENKQTKQSGFINYKQRTHDFDDLERKIIENQKKV